MASALLILLCVVFFCGIVSGCELQKHICKESNRTCEECIRADVCCTWIYEKDYQENRCTSKSSIPENIENIIQAQSSHHRILQNSDFANTDPATDTPAVQIAPQRMKVYLRHGDPINITLTYKAAMNYPLDLYYLMDLTHSMKSHHEHMVKLGNKMKAKLVHMTELYKIAFGFYSDKVLMPYSTMTEKYLKNPCVNDIISSCERGFNFKHALNFTDNFEHFKEKVNASKHTANNDDLEGGFDAVMQIMLCQEEVQWRRISRKIIIVATDGFMHTAGDGILAGTTKRNVDNCLLVKEGEYMVYDGKQYDYPTLEEIYRKLKKNKINILFAIKNKEGEHDNNILDYYTQMVEVMDGIGQAGKLTDDPETILKMVEDAYMRIVKQVSFSLKTDNKYVKVKFFSSCKSGDADGPLEETSTCGDIKIGKEYKFIVNLELTEIPSTINTDSIEIEEKNIEETFKIDIEYTEVLCNCSDQEISEKVDHGEFKCGKYNCEPGWIGETCDKQCDRSSGRHKTENFTSLTCYKRGEFDEDSCKCICDPEYIGTYCEFRQCGRSKKGDICSNHGVCNEGNCECFPPYEGKVCECYTATDVCIAPTGKEICSSHGECKCGKCVCESADYKGQFCEGCKSCQNLCDNYKSAVIAANNGSREEIDQNYNLTKVDELKVTDYSIMCLETFFLKDDDCKIFYTYEIESNKTVHIQHKMVCTKIVNYAQLGGVVFVSVLAVLILLLCIWKLRLRYIDKKEYEEYEKSIRQTNATESNPLYKHPVTITHNPMYNGGLVDDRKTQ